MSVKLSSFVWDGCAASGMKITSVAVMARLADFSSDEGLCWPSIATISRQIGAAPSTVRAAIRKLEGEGWLETTPRRKGNRNTSNMYQLNVKMLREIAFSHVPEFDASKSDAPDNSLKSSFHPPESDASKSGAPDNSLKSSFHLPESGDDPLVNSTNDPSDKKTLCRPSSKADDAGDFPESAVEVLEHLVSVTGIRYQKSKSSLGPIRGRLTDGFTSDELTLTVDYLVAKWGEDNAMCDYLRPETLFRPGKFPAYLASAHKWDAAGRPPRVHGKWQRGLLVSASHNYAIPDGFRGA